MTNASHEDLKEGDRAARAANNISIRRYYGEHADVGRNGR